MNRVIWMNGQPLDWPCAMSVQEALRAWSLPGDRMAVAVNETFVPRSTWAEHLICAGDRVEVLSPVQGG